VIASILPVQRDIPFRRWKSGRDFRVKTVAAVIIIVVVFIVIILVNSEASGCTSSE
jgi:hypothetical protein